MSMHLSQREANWRRWNADQEQDTREAIDDAQRVIARTAELIDVVAADVFNKDDRLIVLLDGREAMMSVVKDGPHSHAVVNGHLVSDADLAIERIAQILFSKNL